MTTQRKGMVLALTGRAGSGKNTVAEILQRELGDEFVIVCEGFADSLKLSAARALGYDPPTTADAITLIDDLKVNGTVTSCMLGRLTGLQISGREFLQRYGTESHRDVFGYDFWVDQVIPPGGWSAPDFDLKIVTDLRFENEAKRVREVGGLIWKVNRPHDGDADGHISEAGVAHVDRVIHNTGDLRSLDERVRCGGHADDLRALLGSSVTPKPNGHANDYGAARIVRDWSEETSVDQDFSRSAAHVEEETRELLEACEQGDLAQITKEACDVVWTAIDVLVAHGIDFNAAFAEVARANRSKIGPGGQISRREDGKIMKGAFYQPPDLDRMLGRGRLAA